MHFAEFNDSFPPQTDGVAQTARNYTYWLNRMPDTQCFAVTPRFNSEQDREEFPVIRFISMPLFLVKDYKLGLPEIAFRTTMRLDSLPLDLVHSHCPFASGTLALKTARKKNIPLVATFHTKFADDFAQRLKMENAGKIAAKYTAAYFQQADEVWAVNSASAETLHEYGYRGPVTVMPNGCDFEPKERTEENRRAILTKYNLTDKPLLLFVGRIVEQKNIGFLLQSLSKLRDNTECNLLLVGDGESMPHYQKMIAELGIKDRVRFAGSVRDRQTLQSIYAAADLFTLPSVYDNAPLVVREAASCGCPSALIANSNAAEGITHDVNGFTADLSPDAYAAMLKNVLGNPQLLQAAGESARTTVYVSWKQIVERAAGEYKRVITTFREKQSITSGNRKYFSIPAVLAQEIFNKQAMRIKFTTRRMNRRTKYRTAIIQRQGLEQLNLLRSKLKIRKK